MLDWPVIFIIAIVHVRALAALLPGAFRWPAIGVAVFLHWLTGGVGITLGYHRLITHRSFEIPKWLDYALPRQAAPPRKTRSSSLCVMTTFVACPKISTDFRRIGGANANFLFVAVHLDHRVANCPQYVGMPLPEPTGYLGEEALYG